jgi:serine/threonine-protein kinase
MTTNADLVKWGEPPTNAAEEQLAELLQSALHSLRISGQIDLPPMDHSSLPDHRDLLETVTWVEGLAASIEEHGADSLATLLEMPDPFPGEFRLQKLLAEGTYGKVWLADDLHIVGRQVALKLLKPPPQLGENVVAALRHEAHLLDSVRHPNIVHLHAVRQSGNNYYLVLQYLAGGSLAARFQEEGAFPWQRACRYVADVGEALVHVHAKGIIHRDIKPANILWNPEIDEAVLTDFGISCRLVETGKVAGTIPYLAPEAFDGSLHPALDVFALAATLFHLITGEVPFPARDEIDHIGLVLDGLPDSDPRCSSMPAAIERLLRQALAADPAQRPTLAEFVTGLRGALNRLLVDSLCLPAGQAPVNLHLEVSREDADGYVAVPLVHSGEPTTNRNRQRMPPVPDRVRLRTGDRIRIQAQIDQPGYVTLFNVGPTGNLHLLWPDPSAPPSFVQGNQPIVLPPVEVTPPSGRERLVAAWSRHPLAFNQVVQLVKKPEGSVSAPYCATRDLERVDQTVRRQGADDRHVVVLELEHEA